jgi:lysophospholipase L1-like esterase
LGALKAANFGIEADRVEHILWRVQNGELDGIKPRAVVLLAGINNSWGEPNVDDETRGRYIASGVAAIVEAIRAKAPGAKIVLVAVFPTGDGLPPCIRVANEAIAKLADGTDVRFLDIGPKMLGPDGKVSKEILPDGLHPSEKGYAIWMEALTPLLETLLRD